MFIFIIFLLDKHIIRLYNRKGNEKRKEGVSTSHPIAKGDGLMPVK